MWWTIFFHRIHRFQRISYIIFPQKLMRWIFVRNAVNFAVNFCKKCGALRWNIYIQRYHRISYKTSPHSPRFLPKFTQKPRPGGVKLNPEVRCSKYDLTIFPLPDDNYTVCPNVSVALFRLMIWHQRIIVAKSLMLKLFGILIGLNRTIVPQNLPKLP